MHKTKFNLWHSAAGLVLLVVVEAVLLLLGGVVPHGSWLVLLFALGGGAWIVVLAAEVVREVHKAVHMLVLLSGVMAEFILYFAFQYHFMLSLDSASFAGLVQNPVALLLQSTMVFVFNPLYLPSTTAAQALSLVNTLGALILVLFIVQNIWQFRTGSADNRL